MTGNPTVVGGGPLEAVLDAARAGIPSLRGVAAATGLPLDVVEAAVDHLVRVGRLSRTPLPEQCGAWGCGSCPLAE